MKQSQRRRPHLYMFITWCGASATCRALNDDELFARLIFVYARRESDYRDLLRFHIVRRL
jgi:hypothetical protein